jgi:hypothetical protein
MNDNMMEHDPFFFDTITRQGNGPVGGYHVHSKKISIGCLTVILHKKDTFTNLPWQRRGFGGVSKCLSKTYNLVARMGPQQSINR